MAVNEIFFGIIFAIIAAICFNLAPIFQKEALGQMDEVKFSNFFRSLFAMFSNKKWILGLFIGLLGGLPYIFAMGLAGLSVVQPVTNFGLIVLVIFGQKRLNEKLNVSGKIAIGLIIILPIFIGFSNVSNVQQDITDPSTISNVFIFMGVILLVALACFLLAKRNPIFLTGTVGIFFALGAYFMQAYTSMLASSGYNLISDMGAVLSNAFIDPNLVIANTFFLILLIFNGLAGFTLQIGLQKVSASRFNPIQQTVNYFMAITGGIIIFNQIVGNWVFYSFGLICGLIGSIVLGRYQV